MSKKKGSGGSRNKTVRVKTAKGRKPSSTRWLQRQLNDPYVSLAKKEGYRSRAAFKLLEIDEKFQFLTPGKRVVDLGAAPGSWMQVAVEKVGAEGQPVIGVDLLEIEEGPGMKVIQGDFLEEGTVEAVRDLLEGDVDVVLSDMAAVTTGHKQTDHLRIMALCEAALYFAVEVLVPGGVFVAKVFQGGAEVDLLNEVKRHFTSIKHVKPSASRSESSEMYLVAQGFKKIE